MRLVLGGANGEYLTDLLFRAEAVVNGVRRTDEVWAAVAYASGARDEHMLVGWCFANHVPLKFWGRLDAGVAVDIEVLNKFLTAKSPDFVCKLVQHHHAKVIWWRGFGVYIGSANLTGSAWYRNVEAGCFIEETELDTTTEAALSDMFELLDSKATPLTDELRDLMIERSKLLKRAEVDEAAFWSHPSIVHWSGLMQTTRKKAGERQRQSFLEEWHSTLQILREVGSVVSRDENRPSWIHPTASPGAQADQFLHAHYYHRTFDGRRADYARHFEANRLRIGDARRDAVGWWRSLPAAPTGEDIAVNVTAKALSDALAPSRLPTLTYDEFRDVADKVHAMVEYARRVPNRTVSLAPGVPYTIPQKLDALCLYLWGQGAGNGKSVLGTLDYVLYGGATDLLPERLWSAISDPNLKLDSMGISALGELVGWAMPDRFPPRNGRTSKALRSLGYDVRMHVS